MLFIGKRSFDPKKVSSVPSIFTYMYNQPKEKVKQCHSDRHRRYLRRQRQCNEASNEPTTQSNEMTIMQAVEDES